MTQGITYALTEIAVFMVAATLIGYLVGRLARASRRDLRRADTVNELHRRLGIAENEVVRIGMSLSEAMDLLHESDERVILLEAENEDLRLSSDPAIDMSSGRPVTEDEVDELLSEIDKQQAMITRLERTVESTGTLEVVLREKDETISLLEAALDEDEERPEPARAYSAASTGSGRYADATIDFELIP